MSKSAEQQHPRSRYPADGEAFNRWYQREYRKVEARREKLDAIRDSYMAALACERCPVEVG